LDRRFWTLPLAPLRVAAVWLLYLLMRLLVLLPLSWQLEICMALGGASRHLAGRRRRIVDKNLELCFPELDSAERDAIARDHFRALGASLCEMAMGWYGAVDYIESRTDIEGLDHLQAALARGRGVILFSGHFTSFEIVFPVLARHCPRLCGMYKAQRNPIMNRIMTRGRGRSVDRQLVNNNPRDMLRELKQNSVFWYASDQSFAEKGAVIIPFFNEPAMTNTAIGRIARMSGATVLPYLARRLPDRAAYSLTIGAPLEDFPSGDPVFDTKRLVMSLENQVRQCPEQYWWIHQRFKSRPAPLPDVYASADEPV